MRLKTFLLAVVAMFAANLNAQSEFELSYCAETRYASLIFDGNKDTNLLISFPEDIAQQYAGCKIKMVQVLGATTMPDVITAYVAEEMTLTDYVTSGYNDDVMPIWNDVELDKPYAITGKPFYIGVHIYNDDASELSNHVVAVDKGPAPLGTNFVYARQGKYAGRWVDVNEVGYSYNFMVRAIVEGDAFPPYDIALTSVKGKEFLELGKATDVTFEIKNVGTEPIKNFTLKYAIDGKENVQNVTLEAPLANNRVKQLRLNGLTPEGTGTHEVTLNVSAPNGEEDANEDNNTGRLQMRVFDPAQAYERNVLLEMFTGQDCVNCPSAHTAIVNAISSVSDAEKRVNMVCHHSGFGDDSFTTAEDNAYTWFYNSMVYAPAYMIDRAFVAGSQDPDGNAVTPVHIVMGQAVVAQEINQSKAKPAIADVVLAGKYDAATQHVDFAVTSHSIIDAFTLSPRLNVWFVEDGIKAPQTNIGLTTHNDIMRTSLTGTWGEEMTYDNGEYTCIFSVDMSQTTVVKPANSRVVAFVSYYDPLDKNNCEVFNVANMRLTDMTELPAGLTALDGDAAVKVQTIYAADGRQVQTMQRGINIVRTVAADGTLRSVKVMK